MSGTRRVVEVKKAAETGAKSEGRGSSDSRYRILLGVCGLVALADQGSKAWVMAAIPPYETVPVIPDFFDLVNIRNRGAAFGFLNRHDIEWQFWLFLVATLVAAGVILALTRAAGKGEKWLVAGLGLVLGGALGNLVDRVRFRAVVDFLDFYVGQWHWPAFNVADIAICCGAAIVCLHLCFGGKGGEKGKETAKSGRSGA